MTTTETKGASNVGVSEEALGEASANSNVASLNAEMVAQGVRIGQHSILDWRDMRVQWDNAKDEGQQGSVSLWLTGTQCGTYKDKNNVTKKVFSYRPVQGGGNMQAMFFANSDKLASEVAELQGLDEIPIRKGGNADPTAGIPKE